MSRGRAPADVDPAQSSIGIPDAAARVVEQTSLGAVVVSTASLDGPRAADGVAGAPRRPRRPAATAIRSPRTALLEVAGTAGARTVEAEVPDRRRVDLDPVSDAGRRTEGLSRAGSAVGRTAAASGTLRVIVERRAREEPDRQPERPRLGPGRRG